MAGLGVLMITAFVDMVGVLAVIPLMPYYALRFGANGLVIGLLVSAFSVAQLAAAPVWGRVSDRYGRRPALLAGLGASLFGYIVFGFADSIWLLFLSLRARASPRPASMSSTSCSRNALRNRKEGRHDAAVRQGRRRSRGSDTGLTGPAPRSSRPPLACRERLP